MAKLGFTVVVADYENPLDTFNALETFRQKLDEAGIDPGDIVDDGKIHRCPTRDKPRSRNGAYCFWTDGVPAGWYQNWADNNGPQTWSAIPRSQMTFVQEAAFDRRVKEANKARAEAKLKDAAEAEDIAAKEWEQGNKDFLSHPYLKNKKIGKHHAKTLLGNLLIPLFDADNKLVNIQHIFPNGHKIPVTGGQYKEVFSFFGEYEEGCTIYIGTGFATCASIFEATGMPTVMAVMDSNLEWTANFIRSNYKDAQIVICGDDDWKTKDKNGKPTNPGRIAAEKAAKASNASVALPVFGEGRDDEWTDFNDLAAFCGVEEVASQLSPKEPITEADIAKALENIDEILAQHRIRFDGDPMKEPEPGIIEDILPGSGTGMIGGQSSVGKSFLVSHLAICVASGQPFFGKEIETQVGVFVLALEGEEGFPRRLFAAKQAMGITKALPIAYKHEAPDFSKPEEVDQFIMYLSVINERFKRDFGVPLGLVVVDTMAAAFRIEDEDGQDDATEICKQLKSLGKSVGAFVMGVKHYGKDVTKGMRGSSAWRDNVDIVWAAIGERKADFTWKDRGVYLDKVREGGEGLLAPFELNFVKLGTKQNGKDYGTMIVREMLEQALAKPKPKRANQTEKSFMEALNDCMRTCSFEHTTKDGEIVRAVLLASIRRHVEANYPTEQEDPAKRREVLKKAVQNGREAALEAERICIEYTYDGDVVWAI